jgi:hypothetical protein
MKINELIQRLREIEQEHGNLEVCVAQQLAVDNVVCMPTAIDRLQHWGRLGGGAALIITLPARPAQHGKGKK